MPKLFDLMGCIIYFWSNEGMEPVHIHISEGKPAPNTTKYWLYSDGTLQLAYYDKRVPQKKLNVMIKRLEKCSKYIESMWLTHFGDITYFDQQN
jgi:hypothetical protein